MGRLEGKVAFITGTAGGQGRAAAVMFAREGAHVIGCDVQDGAGLETVEIVRAAGGHMDDFGPVDLSSYDAASRWIDAGLSAAGRIDILYNNASAGKYGFIEETTPDVWDFTLRNELDIIYNTVRPAWDAFRGQRSGVILNTASVSGHNGLIKVGQLAHCAAKGGVIALTKQLAAEGAPFRIRANSISPGAVLSPGLEAALTPDQRIEVEKKYPIGRLGTPDDIAYCALYLASDEAGWVTGADFVLDGGITGIQ